MIWRFSRSVVGSLRTASRPPSSIYETRSPSMNTSSTSVRDRRLVRGPYSTRACQIRSVIRSG